MMKKSLLAILLIALILMPAFSQAIELFGNESLFLYSEDLNGRELEEAKRILSVDNRKPRSFSVNIDEIILGDNERFKKLALLYEAEDNEDIHIEIVTPDTISASDIDLFLELMRNNNINQGVVYLVAVPAQDEEPQALGTDKSTKQSDTFKSLDIPNKMEEIIDKKKLTDIGKEQWEKFIDYLEKEWKIITDDSHENKEEWRESIKKGITKYNIDEILGEEQLEDLIDPEENSIDDEEEKHNEKDLFIKTFWSKIKDYGHRAWVWVKNLLKD